VARQPLNGELDAMSEPWRSMATHLMSLTADKEHMDAWGAMLAARPELVHALKDVDPSGPPPAVDQACSTLRPRVIMRRASVIKEMHVEWLWKDRLPLGMLAMLAGDPKLGKSFVTIALTAAVSRGASLPLDEPRPAGSVIIMSAEDDAARTIVPRLRAAGADLDKVHILEAVILDDGTEALPSLRSDITRIGEAAAGLVDCRLVVIDPVSAYLDGVDDHNNAQLRGALSPLKALAEKHGFSCVMVSHLTKAPGTNGKHRVSGSIAYVGACRANFLFAKDRDDPSGRKVLMLDNGCNLSDSVPTLAYRIADRGDGPAVEWDSEPVNITTEEALRADTESHQDRSEGQACDIWLRNALSSGPVEEAKIVETGKAAGFSKHQLKRAKQRIGANSKKHGFKSGSGWSWELDGDSPLSGTALEERM
jgi:hypothetical protein